MNAKLKLIASCLVLACPFLTSESLAKPKPVTNSADKPNLEAPLSVHKDKTEAQEIQPTIDVTQSLQEEVKASEDFSSKALTYRDLYRDHISIAQKWGILKSLREKSPDFAKKTYMSCLQSTDWFLRLGGLKFLATVDAKAAIDEAKKLLLEDPALLVRSGAADVIAQNGIYRAKSVLWQALEDEKNFYRGQSLWIRRNIAKALERATDRSENKEWSQFLDDKDEVVKASAVAALEKNNQLQLGEAKDSLGDKANLWKEKLLSQSQFISPTSDLIPNMTLPMKTMEEAKAPESPMEPSSSKENKNKVWDIN